MDDDFRILFDYVEQMKRELQDEADLQSKSAEDEEKKCVHESIETEEAYVCCKCGLVLEDIFQPDIHWCDHALMKGAVKKKLHQQPQKKIFCGCWCNFFSPPPC